MSVRISESRVFSYSKGSANLLGEERLVVCSDEMR